MNSTVSRHGLTLLEMVAIKDTELYSAYFRPALPGNAVSWKVARVRFQARQADLLGGETRAQLQLPTAGGLPSGVVLDESTFYENLLPLLYLVQEVTYTQASGCSIRRRCRNDRTNP